MLELAHTLHGLAGSPVTTNLLLGVVVVELGVARPLWRLIPRIARAMGLLSDVETAKFVRPTTHPGD